jgi:hypothetical protein
MEESDSIGSGDLDLPPIGEIQKAHSIPDRLVFLQCLLLHGVISSGGFALVNGSS